MVRLPAGPAVSDVEPRLGCAETDRLRPSAGRNGAETAIQRANAAMGLSAAADAVDAAAPRLR